MGEPVVRVTWHHADEARCWDVAQAWRLVQRLCEALRALANAETGEQGATP